MIQDLPSMKNKIEGFAIASMSDTTIIFTGGRIDAEIIGGVLYGEA